MKILFRDLDGSEHLMALQPSARALKESDFPTLGFYNPRSRKVAAVKDVDLPVKSMEDGDVVVSIAGIELEPDEEKFDPRLSAVQAQHPSGPLKLVLERKPKNADGSVKKNAPHERLEVVVPQLGRKTLGIVMQIGPVVALRENSPAGKAGMKIGDVIEEINGQPVGNPLSLSQRLIPQSDSDPPYTVVVSRKEGGKSVTKTLSVHAVPPKQYMVDSFPFGGPTSIESMGVAFEVTREISAIESGSPAAEKGLQPGDVAKAVRIIPADAAARKKEGKQFREGKYFDAPNPLDDATWSWTRIHYYLQELADPQTQVELTFDRKGKDV
ncbi:MAG TPA: PDZ domain-containing protein, partial [bacterium]|nr:PDZ domain-containing protein [bacterium]